jgi:hypothetical protein
MIRGEKKELRRIYFEFDWPTFLRNIAGSFLFRRQN